MVSASAANPNPPLALTMGDPSGIGPEIALKCWMSRGAEKIPPFCYLGDLAQIRELAGSLNWNAPIHQVSSISDAPRIFSSAFPVYDIPLAAAVTPGAPSVTNSGAILAAIKTAVTATLSGETCAVVTNPIAKYILQASGFEHPGHTEYLGQLARDAGHSATPVMMIAAPQLRVVPLTIHTPLRNVPTLITEELIVSTALITASALTKLFGVAEPRLAITGLNPHAGENGAIGVEDQTIIVPAIATLQSKGVRATGPHPADTLFHERARTGYDAVIAMYHDQALIPVKTLAFDEGVNVTFGLPFIRTSPDHGTAFDIAGTGRANPSSLMHALRLAHSMASARRATALRT